MMLHCHLIYMKGREGGSRREWVGGRRGRKGAGESGSESASKQERERGREQEREGGKEGAGMTNIYSKLLYIILTQIMANMGNILIF